MAKPVRYSDAKSQSPERSPVKTRPVRLPPCAAGREAGDEHRGAAGRRSPGTGRPQYVVVAERGPLLAVRPARATRRGAGTRGTRRSRGRARASASAFVPEHTRDRTGRVRRRARPARREPDRVVGDHRACAPTSSACSRAAHDRRRRRRRRGAATRPTLARDAVDAGYDVVAVLAGDGTLNEAGGGLAGIARRARAAAGRVDERVRAHARRSRTTREAAAQPARRRRSRRGSSAPHRPRRRHRARRADRVTSSSTSASGFDAAVIRRMESAAVGEAVPRAPGVRGRDRVDTWFRHYDRTHAHPRSPSLDDDGDGDVVGEGPYAVVSNSDPYTYVGAPADAHRAAGRRSTTRSPSP